MWKLISQHEENIQYNNPIDYFDKLLDSLNTNERTDIRFATLIEIGNLAAESEKKNSFIEKVKDYINEIIRKLEPNFALKGMAKYMQIFCDLENNKYVPSFFLIT